MDDLRDARVELDVGASSSAVMYAPVDAAVEAVGLDKVRGSAP